MKRYLFLLCTVSVLVFGCVKDREEDFSSRDTPGRTAEAGQTKDRQENEGKPAEEGSLLMEMESPEQEEEREAAVLRRLESGQRTLLALPRREAIVPQDTEIGALQTPTPYTEPGVGGVRAVAAGFLEGLTEGRIEDQLIHEEWRWFLHSSLEDPLEEGAEPDRYRLGEILIDGETARANVRLLSPRGRVSGEIFLVLSGPESGWKITDFQADLYELIEDYNVTGRFEPKMYDMTDLF